MVSLAATEVYDTPGVSLKLGESVDKVRRAFKRRPDLDARCRRLGGRRIIPADILDALAAEIRSATPDWAVTK